MHGSILNDQRQPGGNEEGKAYEPVHGEKGKLYPGKVPGIYQDMLVEECRPGKKDAYVIKVVQAGNNTREDKENEGNDMECYGYPEGVFSAETGWKREEPYFYVKVGIQAGINRIKPGHPE